jgi:hypothetical protein
LAADGRAALVHARNVVGTNFFGSIGSGRSLEQQRLAKKPHAGQLTEPGFSWRYKYQINCGNPESYRGRRKS